MGFKPLYKRCRPGCNLVGLRYRLPKWVVRVEIPRENGLRGGENWRKIRRVDGVVSDPTDVT